MNMVLPNLHFRYIYPLIFIIKFDIKTAFNMKWFFYYHHEIIIRPGITCKKIRFYIRDSTCWWLIVENVKIFLSFVKHFSVFPRERKCRFLVGLYEQVFMNHPINQCFLTKAVK